MKLITILSLIIALASCNDANHNPERQAMFKQPEAIATDSARIKDSLKREAYLDSSNVNHVKILAILRAYTAMQEFSIKKLKNEAEYYKTGEDKYRIRGNRFKDSANYYQKLLKSYQ